MSDERDRTATTGTTFKIVGTRPMRPDGVDKVTGRARFGADFTCRTMLIGKVLRSPHAHARIKSIDTSKAAGAARREGGRHRAISPTCRRSSSRPAR